MDKKPTKGAVSNAQAEVIQALKFEPVAEGQAAKAVRISRENHSGYACLAKLCFCRSVFIYRQGRLYRINSCQCQY